MIQFGVATLIAFGQFVVWQSLSYEHLDALPQESVELAYDFVRDDSLHKYVGPRVHYVDIRYVPEKLIVLDKRDSLRFSRSFWLRSDAAGALYSMADELFKTTWDPLTIVSAYRSHDYQKTLNPGVDDPFRAKPGHSEHQAWLAIDILGLNEHAIMNDPVKKRVYDWMNDNAHRYGYTQSYQHGHHVDGYHIEPWHWRFVWVEVSSFLKERDMTFTQFYEMQMRK